MSRSDVTMPLNQLYMTQSHQKLDLYTCRFDFKWQTGCAKPALSCLNYRSNFRGQGVMKNQIYVYRSDFKIQNHHVILVPSIRGQPILHGRSTT